MFDTLGPAAPDPIIQLMQAFQTDPRGDKVDLGVGVYRNESGHTPVMRAVKAAEERLLQEQDTKGYLGLTGDPAFHDAMQALLLGGAVETARIACTGTPGGTSALRQILDLAHRAWPDATVWISAPTWPNHPALVRASGLRLAEYRYYDDAAGAVDRDAMLADLEQAQRGDVVLLHGCCHNPTGADPSLQDWADIAALLERRGAVPLIDMAYQGFGDGLDADAAGLRHLAARLPEVLVAASGSKTFGLYRERVGLALAICRDGAERDSAAAALAALNRENFAFPPDHGARIVTTILNDTTLRAEWSAELEAMRQRLAANRLTLARALRAETGSDRFGFLSAQRGMFSMLGTSGAQAEHLRKAHGIYLVGDGRINLAGLTEAGIPGVARAVARTLR